MGKESNQIKHVRFSTNDYIKPERTGGGNSNPLKDVTVQFRAELLDSLNKVTKRLNLTGQPEDVDVCTAVVELESNAIAKSHRPTGLFNEKTCPFFGDAGYGKMLIQVDKSGLNRLKKKISTVNTKGGIKDLSTIKTISCYAPSIVHPSNQSDAVIIRLFRYLDAKLNARVDSYFEKALDEMGCHWIKHPSNSIRLYKVTTNAVKLMDKVSDFNVVQSSVISNSIGLQPMSNESRDADQAEISPPDPLVDYPVVGVVDSGVSGQCPPLTDWIVGYNRKVPEPYRDLNHGTFVSGLISNSRLHNGDPRFPSCQAKVMSVEVLGDGIGDIFDIVHSMYETAENHPEIKVWNLSLGATQPVSMAEISTMAILLDEFQDRFECLCVIAAGNFTNQNRPWPPTGELNDGISSPGDSVRGLTVGSLAHIDGFVKNEEPSPFSRKGPVSNYVQKPDLVHFGGNLLTLGNSVIPIGVGSVCPLGQKRHDIGTSFSTPLVSTLAANLFQILGSRATPNLVKALLIHSANTRFSNLITGDSRPYYGWGIPADLSTVLQVSDYETTLAFEGHAQQSFEVEKLPFPIPQCLRTEDGKVRGEFFVTLVYQPELDRNKAFEYCQVDVRVGLGEMENGKFCSKVPPLKDSHTYEKDLVKDGDKWSPIKVYHKRFPRGIDIQDWRLRVSVLDRDGYDAAGLQIPFTILLTIRDIDKEKPVYNEMVHLMNAYNWEVSDLAIDSRIQV